MRLQTTGESAKRRTVVKVLAIIKVTFGLAGAGMLAAAIALGTSTRLFIASAQHAEGTVIDILPSRSSSGDSVLYSPVVAFTTADGREFEVRSSVASDPPGYQEGDKVTVLYTPDAPDHAQISGFFSLWGATMVMGILGTVFFCIGAVLWAVPAWSARRARHLTAHGTPVQAEVQEVERNTRIEVNGVHPWRIVARWKNPVTAEYHEFRSQNLWTDPGEHQFITVFVDNENPKRYHVDTSFMAG